MSLVISVPIEIYVYCLTVNYKIKLELPVSFEGQILAD